MKPSIKKAADKLELARANMRQVLDDEQGLCDHKRVIHSKWRSSEWFNPFKARRLCLDCGLEEEAKNSGWGDNDGDFRFLKTQGFHKEVSPDELYRARFPEARVES
jgi:hypothetical protein